MTTLTGEQLYQQREQRFNDIVALRKPDRVPVIPLVAHYFPTKVKGVSNRDAGFDHELRLRCLREATTEFGWDMLPATGLFGSDGYEALGSLQLRWPGGDLPDDTSFQFVEGEYLKAEEYPRFLADPSGTTLSTIFPRIAGKLEGLGMIPPLFWLSNMYYLQGVGGGLLAAPPVRAALQALLDLGDAAAAGAAADAAHGQAATAQGYPRTWMAPIIPAFDVVSDTFRSLRGSTLDMFRHPDELLQTIDLMQVPTVALAVGAAQMFGNPRIFIPMHRGAGGFMSDAQFERFYWPTFKALIETLVEHGLVPMPLFEGDYTPRLKYLAELPAGKVAGHFDKVDRKQFKDVLGDRMCFWGNVAPSLLCTGTPQQVKDDVKELVELFGDSGALILDSGLGVPDEARPENMVALREAADEYGVF
jgi:Uroporphyrinogen decarboxylase (URO-D)